MAYSARNQESAVRRQYRPNIEGASRRVAEYARDGSREGRRRYERAMARREELRWEERELVDECWDAFESVWGVRPV